MIDLTVVPSALLVPVLEGNLRRLEKRHKVYDHVLEAVRLDLGADAAWLDRGVAGGGERLVAGDERRCAFDLSQSLIDETTSDGGAGRSSAAGATAAPAEAPPRSVTSAATTALVSTVAALLPATAVAVSYTHLTLPTILRV